MAFSLLRSGGSAQADAVLPLPPPLDGARDALFLDLDGTLVPIAERPDLIVVDEPLRALLRQAGNQLAGRLVVVTGRAIADLDRHLHDAVPNLAGIHGAELRGAAAPPADPRLVGALLRARAGLRDAAPQLAGLLVEDKGMAIALHYRQHPEFGAEAGRLAAQLANDSDGLLAVQPGRMVIELKPREADKGRAVAAFLAEQRFAGARPIFVGDDLTDEAGFRAAAEAGGFGVLVGQRAGSAAHYALPDVAAVRAWIGALAGQRREARA